jgi:hypothetical protein
MRHSTPALLSVAAGAALAAASITHMVHLSSSDKIAMPDQIMTPGDVIKGVTAEQICVSGYAHKVRNVPESTKRQVYKNYKITSHKPGEYEVDHLISLELGGSNDIKNLWPQPYNGLWNAHMKDKLENKLHELVCAGTLSLEDAQHDISTDWVEAYQKYISN